MQRMITTLTTPPALLQGDIFANDVRIVWENDAPLFVMKDVCDVLGITWYRNAQQRLHKDERCGVTVHTLGGPQEMMAVTESGLYHLIFMSTKPVAKAFRRWVTSEVLPALRRHGYYAMPGAGNTGVGPAPCVHETASHYLENRGLSHLGASGVSLRCRNLCEARGIAYTQSWSGFQYPVHILDLAVAGRDEGATRGPAVPDKPAMIRFGASN